MYLFRGALPFVLVSALVNTGFAVQKWDNEEIVKYQYQIEEWLTQVDADLSQFNTLFAHLTWKLSTQPDEKTSDQAKQLGKAKNRWKNKVCDSTIRKQWLTDEQSRKLYLLCRGPRFTEELSDMYLNVMEKLSEEYNAELCMSSDGSLVPKNSEFRTDTETIHTEVCVHGEPDLERSMKNTSLTLEERKWIWLSWHNSVGPRVKDFYRNSVFFQNLAAQNNGYHDMGEVWREELEIPHLEKVVMELYEEIKPLYILLHAFIRHVLLVKYGKSVIDEKGPIPIHLLGNMWGQDWSPLINEIFHRDPRFDLNEHMRRKNWTVRDMISQAEDYYVSLNLPRMTEKFWKFSVFERSDNTSVCHGTAANMYSKDDYRMLFCADVTMEDFYVIHHEMGHMIYYMAYSDKPAIFQEGTNSAFHESIGDAIMHGVLTPQHLYRLGLISDEDLKDPLMELYILFRQALSQIPEIPFALVIDKYRWDIFSGKTQYGEYNRAYWDLNRQLRGIIPPETRNEEYFDAGGKFHVPDNTPYIRYFLSGIMQMEIFESLCEITLYGENVKEKQKETLGVPLHRCDIYGSKKSGKRLMSALDKGASITWYEAMKRLTGNEFISTKPLLQYYKPVYNWLKQYIDSHNVFVGW